MEDLSLSRILIDGTVLSLIMGVTILGSLYYNPRLWLHDYPKPIQAKVPPATKREKQLQKILLVPFLLVMIGVPLVSTVLLKQQLGGEIPFVSAYLNAFFVANIFNLFDAVVLDLLILTLMKPGFAVIPGAEGMEYLYRDWNMHLVNYGKGVVFCTVFSLPIALAAMVI